MAVRSALTRVFLSSILSSPAPVTYKKEKTMETIDRIVDVLTEGKDYAYVDDKVFLSEDVVMKVALSASMAVLIHGKGDAMSVFAGLMPDLLNALDRKRG